MLPAHRFKLLKASPNAQSSTVVVLSSGALHCGTTAKVRRRSTQLAWCWAIDVIVCMFISEGYGKVDGFEGAFQDCTYAKAMIFHSTRLAGITDKVIEGRVMNALGWAG